jgi:uncharacterized membrane protein YraQ (UPF0718 family)
MLCSCGVAPVFAAVQEGTRRAGAAVGLMIACPAINLPSLLTVVRSTTTPAAVLLGAETFLAVVAGGLLV